MPHSVIDMCALLYDRACWSTYLGRLASDAPEYLSVFAGPFCAYFGTDRQRYDERLAAKGAESVAELLVEQQPDTVDLAAHLARLDRDGVAVEVLHGWPGDATAGEPVNDRVARLAAAAPDRLRAWAGLRLHDPDEAVAEIHRCHRMGMSGVCVFPFLDAVDVAEAQYREVFATAEDLGLPLWLHTGNHFNTRAPLDLCDWRTLDRLAARHRDLVIVAGHGGWPWIREIVAVVRRHPNVYVEFSSHRPRTMARSGSGWEPLLCYGRGIVRDKVLFGSCTWVQPVPVSALADEVADLGLGDTVVRSWLRDNAAALLGLSPRELS